MAQFLLDKALIFLFYFSSIRSNPNTISVPNNKGFIGLADVDTELGNFNILILIISKDYTQETLKFTQSNSNIHTTDFFQFGIYEKRLFERFPIKEVFSLDKNKLDEIIEYLCETEAVNHRVVTKAEVSSINYISKSRRRSKLSMKHYATTNKLNIAEKYIDVHVSYSLVLSPYMDIDIINPSEGNGLWACGCLISAKPFSRKRAEGHEDLVGLYNDGRGYKKLKSFELTSFSHKRLWDSLNVQNRCVDPTKDEFRPDSGNDGDGEGKKGNDSGSNGDSGNDGEGEEKKGNDSGSNGDSGNDGEGDCKDEGQHIIVQPKNKDPEPGDDKENKFENLVKPVSSKKNKIVFIILGVEGLGIFLVCLFLCLAKRRKNAKKKSIKEHVEIKLISNDEDQEVSRDSSDNGKIYHSYKTLHTT